jgi:hypothetical protein
VGRQTHGYGQQPKTGPPLSLDSIPGGPVVETLIRTPFRRPLRVSAVRAGATVGPESRSGGSQRPSR